MKKIIWTNESSLYLLAILLALLVRFLRLGALPLSDPEAAWAMQALNLARSQPGSLGPQPLYLLFTSLFFTLFDSSALIARLLPAISGALLILLPLLFRDLLGRGPAVILAIALALDPGLVALSRTAGSNMPALAFGLLALGAAYRRRPAAAGVLAALALLSGPSILMGALGFALAWGAWRLLERAGVLPPLGSPGAQVYPEEGIAPRLRLGIFFCLAVLLIAGSLFFRYPQGLGALAATVPAFLSGWSSPSGIPALRLPAALLVYQPLAAIFGLVSAVRSWLEGDSTAGLRRRLSLWVLIALFLSMLYPARQVGDLAWALVPLWGLAALEIYAGLTAREAEPMPLISLGQAALIVILLAFSWINLAGLSHEGQDSGSTQLSALLLIGGASLMAAVTTVLVALGWAWPTARRGLVWGVLLALGLYMASTGYSASQLRAGGDQQLWGDIPSGGEQGLFAKTLGDLSQWQTGFRSSLDVTVLADSPSLRWALRDWPKARFASELASGDSPSIVVTYKETQPPSLAVKYRGEGFSWEVYPSWQGILPPDLASWLTFHTAPAEGKQVILWARADLFPGGAQSQSGGPSPSLPQAPPPAQLNPPN